MSRNVPAPLLAELLGRATTLCLCWKVTREDGTVMGFTDHDQPVPGTGVTFEASASFTASAIEDQLGLAVSNLDVVGALSSDAITSEDLECGRYDNATVVIYLVNWKVPTQSLIVRSGTLGQVQIGDLAFQAELRSLAQHFAQLIGSLCGPKCRSQFGATGAGLESGCRFDVPAPVPGTISAVTDRTHFTVSAVGSFPDGERGSLAGGYFAFGTVKFTGGANLNVAREVESSTEALEFVTCEPFPAEIQVGDAVELQIGCDKLLETCSINYDNVVNFRGEPYVPGTDTVFKVNT